MGQLLLSRKNKKLLGRPFLYAALIIVSAFFLLPFLWMISASLQLDKDVFRYPFHWIPKDPRWQNYKLIWKKIPLLTFTFNSFKLSIIITFLQLLTSSFAAYAFAKMDFKGRDVLFLAYIATIAIPWQAYMVPQFIMMRGFGLENSHMALILLQAFSAFGVFMIRQFYLSVPNELLDAARIDGLTEYGIYLRVMLPLSKPALATLTIFTFVFVWNDLMGPLIYLNSEHLKTIQLGIKMFIAEYSADYSMIMASSLVAVIPVLVLFLFLQNFFIEGIATSGIKG